MKKLRLKKGEAFNQGYEAADNGGSRDLNLITQIQVLAWDIILKNELSLLERSFSSCVRDVGFLYTTLPLARIVGVLLFSS